MHFPTRFLVFGALLAFLSTVTALSVDVTGRAEAAVRETKVFEFSSNTDVMAPHDVELVRRAGWTYRNNQSLVMLLLVKNAYIINATCGSGNIYTCAIGAAYSAITFFFAAFKWQDRADTADEDAPFFVYPPTPGTGRMVNRLRTELAAGQWHYVGHVPHQGLNHTVHYFTDGRIQRLRARTVPFWNETGTLDARDDPANDGGFVADYSWISNNEGPYDSFHSTSDGSSFFASNAGGYMMANEGIAACASFQDAQGTLDNGLLTYGWNNQEFQWTNPGEENAAYSDCASQLNL